MIRKEDNLFRVEGPITLHTVRAIMEEGLKLFDHDAVEVDLSGVTEVDSAAVALILEWLRRGSERGQTVRFARLPENVKSLAAMYGVLELIPASE